MEEDADEAAGQVALARHWRRHLVVMARALEKRPSRRNSEERRPIFVLLQSIPLLYDTLNVELLMALTSMIHLQHFPSANTVVFQQGDDVINFYIVLEGTLIESRAASQGFHRSTSHIHSGSIERYRLTEGHVFGFENPSSSLLERDDQRSPRPTLIKNHLHISSPSMRVQSRDHELSPASYNSTSSTSSKVHSSCASFARNSHSPACRRQTTVYTEGKCHVLYANWWQFCQLVHFHRGHSPSKVLTTAHNSIPHMNSITKDSLQVIFHAFSDRRHCECLTSGSSHEFTEQSPAKVSSVSYREEEAYLVVHSDEMTNEKEEADFSVTMEEFSSPTENYRDFSDEVVKEKVTRNYGRRRNSTPSSSPTHTTVVVQEQKPRHTAVAAPPTVAAAAPTTNSTKSSPPPSSSASNSMTQSSMNGPTTSKEEIIRPSIGSAKHPTTGSFHKTSHCGNPPEVIPEIDKASIWKAATVIGEGLICDYFDEFLGCKKMGKPLYWSGTVLITWLCDIIHSQDRIVMKGVWQALLEEGILVPKITLDNSGGTKEVLDRKQFEYGFSQETSRQFKVTAREDEVLTSAVTSLLRLGVDTAFRNILRKPPSKRLPEELNFVYNEMVNHKALSSLSNMVKRQLVSVVEIDIHINRVGEAVFRQGDEGDSWYIILKGSVDVHVAGKGVICTLYEGDDFGNLALINKAPRAATILLKSSVCQFLKVYKEDFDRILLDVEANTVRLKEHGRDVLVLSKSEKTNDVSPHAYSIIAGTVEKIVENILESRIHPDKEVEDILEKREVKEPTLRDFLFCYPTFSTTNQIVEILNSHLIDEPKRIRAAVVLLWRWFHLMKQLFVEEVALEKFIDNWLQKCNSSAFSQTVAMNLSKEKTILSQLLELIRNVRTAHQNASKQQPSSKEWRASPSCHWIAQTDILPVQIYYTDKICHKIFMQANASAKAILETALRERAMNAGSDKFDMNKVCLCEVKSTGEVIPFKHEDIGVTFRIAHTSRLFIADSSLLKEVQPILQQQMPTIDSNANFLELVNAEEFAVVFCHFDWHQFCSVQPHELLYNIFGRDHFDKISPNLDRLLQRFHRVQTWVVSEVLCVANVHQRCSILRKFIKLSHSLLQMKNLNTFVAIVMALNSTHISRLRNLWDKIPNKQMRLFRKFSTLLDSSHNNCMFRQKFQSFRPPFIPFVELLLNELACIHTGNQTRLESSGLVNFEKSQLLGRLVAYFDEARSVCGGPFQPPAKRDKNYEDLWNFVESLPCVEDPRRLTALTQKLESKR